MNKQIKITHSTNISDMGLDAEAQGVDIQASIAKFESMLTAEVETAYTEYYVFVIGGIDYTDTRVYGVDEIDQEYIRGLAGDIFGAMDWIVHKS
jgi:hypothetical protein